MLHNYQINEKLTPVSQKHLMDEIFSKVSISKWDIGNHTCCKIAKKIIEIFPNESMELYYLPPKSTGEKQVHSKGLIPNKLRNCQRFFKFVEKVEKSTEDFDKIVNGTTHIDYL